MKREPKHRLPDTPDRPLVQLRKYTNGPGADTLPTLKTIQGQSIDDSKIIQKWNDPREADLTVSLSSDSLDDDSLFSNAPNCNSAREEFQFDIRDWKSAQIEDPMKPGAVVTNSGSSVKVVGNVPVEGCAGKTTKELGLSYCIDGSAASINKEELENKNRQHKKEKIKSHGISPKVAYSAYQPFAPDRKKKPIATRIQNPTKRDVLCGRGGRSNNHPGNKFYLALRNQMSAEYFNTVRKEKKLISQRLVDVINVRNGRFLKRSCEDGLWYEITNGEAREKTAQALREGKHP